MQKLLSAGGADEKDGSVQQPPAKLSFLDQIKAKRNGPAAAADSTDVSTASAAQPVSFLDAIKSRRVE